MMNLKLVLKTRSLIEATNLKKMLLELIKDETILTWSHKKANDNKDDVIFHNPSQYVNDPTKNVIFLINIEQENLVFESCYWKRKDEVIPTDEMFCYHAGRLTEILLVHLRKHFIYFLIVK